MSESVQVRAGNGQDIGPASNRAWRLSRLRPAEVYLPLLLLALLSTRSLVALHGMWTDWSMTTLTHGYLVVGVSLWLLWRNTCRIPSGLRQPWPRAFPALAGLATIWVFFVVAGFQFAGILLLPVLFGAGIWYCFGTMMARRSAFALAYLWFATPLPGVVTPALQWVTVHVVRLLLWVVGIPAYFEGNIVRIPSGTFEIQGGCAGAHFFAVALALAALLGELRGDSSRRRIRLLAWAAVFAMLTNWARVFFVVLAGHLTQMQHYLVTQSHYGFGWALFAVAMAAFLAVERRIPADVCRFPALADSVSNGSVPRKQLLVLALMVLVLSSWHRLSLRPYAGDWSPMPAPTGWEMIDIAPNEWQPVFRDVDVERLERWAYGKGQTVDRYLGLFRRQLQGKEFTGFDNMPRGASTNEAWAFAEQYRVNGWISASPVRAQFIYGFKALIFLQAPLSEVQVLRSPCQADCAAAERRLGEWRR